MPQGLQALSSSFFKIMLLKLKKISFKMCSNNRTYLYYNDGWNSCYFILVRDLWHFFCFYLSTKFKLKHFMILLEIIPAEAYLIYISVYMVYVGIYLIKHWLCNKTTWRDWWKENVILSILEECSLITDSLITINSRNETLVGQETTLYVA